MRRLTNLALIRNLLLILNVVKNPQIFKTYFPESMGFEPMKIFVLTSFKLVALNHSANSLIMIPQRLELQTHPYQEYALPIKLRNLKI